MGSEARKAAQAAIATGQIPPHLIAAVLTIGDVIPNGQRLFYMSVEGLAERTGKTRRATQKNLRQLEDLRILIKVSEGGGRASNRVRAERRFNGYASVYVFAPLVVVGDEPSEEPESQTPASSYWATRKGELGDAVSETEKGELSDRKGRTQRPNSANPSSPQPKEPEKNRAPDVERRTEPVQLRDGEIPF